MKKWFCIYFILFSVSGFSQIDRDVYFQEILTDSVKRQVDKILIIGIGATNTRIFLDKLTDKMVKQFKKNKVDVDYLYLGRGVPEARVAFKKLPVNNYPAILLFLPKDSAFFFLDEVVEYYPGPSFGVGGGNVQRGVRPALIYEQAFDIQLFTGEETRQLVWAAEMEIAGELTRRTIYPRISEEIIRQFKRYGYIKQ